MYRVLGLLAARADADVVEGLPLQSFEVTTQHELAFRTLQSGLYVGKIMTRVASRTASGEDGQHVVTGGTGGLALITTDRWLVWRSLSRAGLAQRQARRRYGGRSGRAACRRHRTMRHAPCSGTHP